MPISIFTRVDNERDIAINSEQVLTVEDPPTPREETSCVVLSNGASIHVHGTVQQVAGALRSGAH